MKEKKNDSKDKPVSGNPMKTKVTEVKLGDVVGEDDSKGKEIVFISKDLTPPDDPPWTWEGVEVVPPPNNISAGLHNWKGREKIDQGLLKEVLKNTLDRCNAIYLSDRIYLEYTLDEMVRFLSMDKTSFKEYIPEYYDCDDFSKTLMGNVAANLPGCPFGIIWYYGIDPKGKFYGHSVNIFYDAHKKEIVLIEPQNDKMYKFTKGRMVAQFVMI